MREAVTGLLLFSIGVACYLNATAAMGFVFDDHFAVVENTDMQQSTPVCCTNCISITDIAIFI